MRKGSTGCLTLICHNEEDNSELRYLRVFYKWMYEQKGIMTRTVEKRHVNVRDNRYSQLPIFCYYFSLSLFFVLSSAIRLRKIGAYSMFDSALLPPVRNMNVVFYKQIPSLYIPEISTV